MKKSILLGCIAACALSATMAFAEVVKPNADEVKAAFTEFLAQNTQVDTLFNLEQMQVTPAGDGFDLVLPATQNEIANVQTQTIHLTYAGEFNNHAQYKIESPFENVQSLFRDILPDATFTADSADMTMIWVPAYNLVSKNSQNITGLKVSVPNMMDLSVGSLVSDTLVRVVSENKMDAADSTDGHDVQLSAENAVIVVPAFSYESSLEGSDITADPIDQMISSSNNTFKYNLPDVQLKMMGAAAPMAALSIVGQGAYQNEALHFENKFGNITSPTLGAFAPAALIPDEVSIDFDIEGVSKEVLAQLTKKAQSGEYTDEDIPALKQAIETGVFKFNLLEAKNTLAGVAVSGTIRLKLKDAASVTTIADMQANLEPVVEAKVVVTNLDQISPEPKVDQAQCDIATELLNSVDMSAPDADAQRESAEMRQEIACAPQGGPLDLVRPYLDTTARVVGSDGKTTDTFVVTYEDNTLVVNGKQVQ